MIAQAVSVVIPTYNRAHLLPRALHSALPQLGADDEVIVADDGSHDDTERVVRGFGPIVRFVAGSRGGAGAARNRGLREATRPLVAFLDSDDEWRPGKLAMQRAFLARRPSVLFCFSNFASQNEDRVERAYLAHWHRDPRPWDEILGPGVWFSSVATLERGWADFRVHVGDMFLPEMLSDYVATSTVVVRRQEAGDALRFADDLRISEDKECFGRLAQKGPGAYFDVDLSVQWTHSGPRVSDADVFSLAAARITLMKRIWAVDAAFMTRHSAAYAEKLRQQYLIQARWLLARGRTAEARQRLLECGHGPWHYHLLASLPGPVARGLLSLRRAIGLGGK